MNAVFRPEDIGTSVTCRRCGQSHELIQPHNDATTADRHFVYVVCRGQQYFMGQVVVPPTLTRRKDIA